MKKFVGFGDFLVRLNPTGYQRFIQALNFEVNYTGAEANVCVSLAMMGVETEFVTRIPDNDIAYSGIATMRKYDVGTRHIKRGGDRMGLIYVEKGASQRPSKVVYDRKFTSFAASSADDYDWDVIFRGAGNFHITGITPALGVNLPAICEEACRAAQSKKITVSCDLNYRKNLWSCEEARSAMERILPYVDILIANEEDAEKVLGIRSDGTDVNAGIINHHGYSEVAAQIHEKYGISTIATTLRRSISASDNEWTAMLYSNGESYFSRTYPIHLVDRIGGGDSFAAGLLYALMNNYDEQRAIEYAAAASCLKQTIEQDFNLCGCSEIEALAAGDCTGRVQR